MEVRYSEEEVIASFTEAADADPLDDLGDTSSARTSVTEQLGLGGGKFVVGQDALLMQRSQLVQLVDHGRRLRRGWLLLVRRLLLRWRRLLFQIAEARVLLRLLLGLLIPLPGHMLSGHVRASAYHGRTQQRTSSPEHVCLLDFLVTCRLGASGRERP
ncbi:MAG: hypothetical protein WAK82_14485 [Streptosporangiaceae bacterium]